MTVRGKIIEALEKRARRAAIFEQVGGYSTSSLLLDSLLKSDKKGLFKVDNTSIFGFPSGNPLIDALNGYLVCVPNKDHTDLDHTWYNKGIMGGQFIMVIGNSGVGKSAFCIQCAANIVKDYDEGLVIHADAEHTSSYPHIMNLTGWGPDLMDTKYRLNEINYIEDLRAAIIDIARIKEEHKKELIIHTGRYDSFGREIKIYVPTVIIADSLPQFQTKEILDKDGNVQAEQEGQTYDMRLAAAYSKFYKIMRPILHDKNIILFVTNHIKEKPQMGFTKKQAKIQGLSPDETLPGGSAPIYLSQSLIRLIYRGKCITEKHGFNGYVTAVQTLKSKTNRSDLTVELVFEHGKGFNTPLSMLRFADSLGLVGGRNPYRYFTANPDKKFSTKNFCDSIDKDPEIYQTLLKITEPYINNICASNKAFNPNKDISAAQLESVVDNSFHMYKDVSKDTLADALEGIGA